ncbi:MAG: hypothetical protein QM758_06270 [Armatimonas sp.]
MSDRRHAFTSAAHLSAFLIESLGRKQGDVMDATDVRLYREALFPVIDAIRTGRLTAVFEPAPDGVAMPAPACSPEIWQVIAFIRGAEFRPGCEVVAKKVREVLGVSTEPVPGGEARARRVITAPLRLPWGPAPEEPPLDPEAPWIKRFARELSRGDDAFDSALLSVLARLPTDAARDRAITELAHTRDASAALRAAQTEGAGRCQERRATEKSALQIALETVAAYRTTNKENTTPS